LARPRTISPAPADGGAFSNQTLRMMPRVSLGGQQLRVRVSNAYGSRPLAIGAAREQPDDLRSKPGIRATR
jgi:hypothetical protein